MAGWICPNCQWDNSLKWEKCAKCGVRKDATLEEIALVGQINLKHIYSLTTTPKFEGKEIEEYLGVVSAVVVLGTGFFSELSAGIADAFGTRSTAFQNKLDTGQRIAMEELWKKAETRGANAVAGVDIEFMTMESNMFMISVNGTAVRIGEK